MAYTKQTWTDGPAGGTPMSAARLGHLEDGVAAAAVIADLGTPGTPTGDAARAAFGSPGRSAVTVYDEFSSYADGALAGKQPMLGAPWVTSGAQPSTVASGLATSTGTGYMAQILASPVAEIACEVVWSGSGSDQAMTLISSTDSQVIIANAVHFNFGPVGFNLTVRKDAGTFDTIIYGNWNRACKVDGATAYRVGMQIRGNTVILVGPNGEPFAVTDPRVGQLNGTMAIWEPGVSGATKCGLRSVAAATTATHGQPSALDMLGAVAVGLAGGVNGTVAGSRNTYGEVSVGLDASSGQPAVIFGPAGPILTTLSASVAVGGTSITTDQFMPSGVTVQIESGSNSETVTATGNSSGTGPYTTPVSATTKAHPAGSAVAAMGMTQAKVTADQFGGLTIRGPVIQGSGADQFALGGGPDGAGLYFGNAYDTGIFRADAGVMRLRSGTVLRQGSGTTGQRPTALTAGVGAEFYDTTLHKPIWSDGATWRDATGTAV